MEKRGNIPATASGRGRLIFFLALLVICLLFDIVAAVLFEYYTVSTSEGQIIFSLSMSWQLILFIIEVITIVIQIMMVINSLRKYTERYYKITLYSGGAAALTAAIAATGMIITQGIKAAPSLFFTLYAIGIIVLRLALLLRVLRNGLSGQSHNNIRQ